ncbi:MAG TPA: 16S rRNA (guanine(966)-N(2))-methyltransferase RsmD, partial [Chloroflexota bacterium]|nr:16S rRNA (guanine(966)-N(2))-methyltransferase RsmD [Chloroflexota bacterium]
RSGAARIRPTSDKVRGALFDILAERLEGARVLDAYAGTGALAIEALSRGAAGVDLVETDKQAQAIIQENLQRTGLSERAQLWRMRVEKALPLLPGQYDLILADPPYAESTLAALLASLEKLAADRGIVVLEHASRVTAPDNAGQLQLWKRRRHGDTTLSIYERVLEP